MTYKIFPLACGSIERKIAHAAGDFNFMERLLCFLGARRWGSGFGEDDGVVDPLF